MTYVADAAWQSESATPDQDLLETIVPRDGAS